MKLQKDHPKTITAQRNFKGKSNLRATGDVDRQFCALEGSPDIDEKPDKENAAKKENPSNCFHSSF